MQYFIPVSLTQISYFYLPISTLARQGVQLAMFHTLEVLKS